MTFQLPLLQWSRARLSAEIARVGLFDEREGWLQWSRARLSAEMLQGESTFIAIAASMEPRSFERGDAASLNSGRGTRAALQWSRARLSAEMSSPPRASDRVALL